MLKKFRYLQGQLGQLLAECRANFRVRPACLGSHVAGFQESPKINIPPLIQCLTTFAVKFSFSWNNKIAYKLVMNKFR